MNVRIEDQNFRFKITEDELGALLDGHCLHTKVNLPDRVLVATINPQGRGEMMEPKLVTDDQDVYLNLLVPLRLVQELSDMGRSRDGLKQAVGGLSVSLQVDMREVCHA